MTETAELMPFAYDGHEVRVELIDDEPWFVAADLCAVLGLANPREAVKRLNPADVRTSDARNARGELRPTNYVNEPGFYRLVLRSNKPGAIEFQDVVAHEILPSIRKTGSYTVPAAEVSVSDDRALMMQTLKTMQAQAEATTSRFEHGNQWIKGFQADVAQEIAQIKEAVGLNAAPEDRWVRARVFCKEAGLPPETAFTNPLGRRARAIGTREGLSLRPVFDSEFGSVNTWPRWVWEQAASEMGGGTVTRIS